jgi:hypothetical protein
MKILSILLVFYVAYNCHAISDRDLYTINAPGSTSLLKGNEESRLVQLQSPIHFYSEKYDSIYVSSSTSSSSSYSEPPMLLCKEGSTSVVIYLDSKMTMMMLTLTPFIALILLPAFKKKKKDAREKIKVEITGC